MARRREWRMRQRKHKRLKKRCKKKGEEGRGVQLTSERRGEEMKGDEM